jgi:hypothetical protein
MTIAADTFLQSVQRQVRDAQVFGTIDLEGGMLRCAAKASAAPAWYRLERDGGRWFVSLVTPDRWLSESIEADLMHHGDPLEELIEDELAERGQTGASIEVKHYRSEDRLYTFRSPLPLDGLDERRAAEVAAAWLLAYEAAFRELGDIEAGEDE